MVREIRGDASRYYDSAEISHAIPLLAVLHSPNSVTLSPAHVQSTDSFWRISPVHKHAVQVSLYIILEQ
jgi:hypothetical protein